MNKNSKVELEKKEKRTHTQADRFLYICMHCYCFLFTLPRHFQRETLTEKDSAKLNAFTSELVELEQEKKS